MESTPPLLKGAKILCTNIPQEFLNKSTARIHFSQYGRIVRIFIKLKSRMCIVEYEHRQQAKRAIVHGGQYKGQNFDIKWYPRSPIKKKRLRKTADPEWLPDPEIQKELNAMAALGDVYSRNYNLRPETPEDFHIKKPPILTKRAIWKNKPKNTILLEDPNAWTSEQLDLLKVLKQQAFTMEEKFKILEARDKLIRFRTRKPIDITKTSPTVGTCPDMCPEKERLMRVVQHQVALYEQDVIEKTMNPAIAIKQYSRSSADQETPLPHELRPVSVLQLTMGYLMHSIMNLCDTNDVNLGEWYHFLWDRTRSIRKDITQQELCSQGSVELMEQCARFHIHCSARLVAEETSVFDQKINTENLTKCLQTLKYMYQDLDLKGESCSNEAEFRAYIILLNLNDGNFMWEVQQLKLEVQRSKEIKFALKVYLAIDQNNFVKFFKLVRSTGYLNACILMRYFIQVRSRALSTILKCYSPRTPYNQFIITELQNLLAFEDTESTIEFIVAHGLYLTPDETQVVLDKKSYQLPEIPLLLDRAISTVESKRKLSVGEVVCGAPLPPPLYQNYIPHSSFNENGYLIINDVLFDIIRDSQREVTIDEPDTAGKIENLLPTSSSLKTKVNIFSSKSNPPFSEQTTDQSLPFWAIKKEPKTSMTNIFGSTKSQPPPDIFNIQKSAVFPFKQTTFPDNNQKSSEQSTNIFGGEQPELSKNIFGNVQPFKTPSVFTDDNQKSQNIFAQQPSSNFVFTKPDDAGDSNDAEKPPKSIFGEQQPKSGIFGEQSSNKFAFANLKPPESVKSIFGGETKLNVFAVQTGFGERPETIFGGPSQSRQPSAIFGQQPDNIFSNAAKFGEDKVSSVVDPNLSDILGKDVEMAVNDSFTVGLRKSPDLDQENAEKMEQERLLKLEKERQSKLEMEEIKRKLNEDLREMEEARRKMEEMAKRLREEEKRKEAERLKQIKEAKKKAILEDKKRKIELEIRESVATVMIELLDRVEELEVEERLKELSTNIKNRKMSLFVQKWRQRIRLNKRKRHAMDQNPIWLPSRTIDEEAQELFVDAQNHTLQNIKRYKFGKSFDVMLPQKLQMEKINLHSIYRALVSSYSKMYRRSQKEIFWKVTVSLPDFRELKFGLNVVENVLTDFFNWKDRYGSTAVVDQYKEYNKLFGYCIEKKQGVLPIECNSNGLLFISHEPTELLQQRITDSLKNFPLSARLPIAVILINNNAASLNTLPLGKTLEADRRIGNYDILACKFTNTALINAVKQSLDFLAKFMEKTPPLELNTLYSFIYENLVTELWRRITSYAVWNSKYKECLKSPFLLINLYNDGIDKLKDIALDRSSLQFSNFPDEFDKFLMDKVPDVLPCDYKYFPPFWKSDSYRTLLLTMLNSLKLSQYTGEWPPKSEFELEKDVYTYSSKAFKHPKPVFYKIMAKLLKNVDPVRNFQKIEDIFWIDAIQVLTLQKLQETDFSLHHTEFYSKSIFEQLFVIYNVKSLEAFRSNEWFYLEHPLVKVEIQKNSKESKQKTRFWSPEVDYTDLDLDQIESDVRAIDVTKEEELNCKKSKIRELESFMNELQETMEIQKKINSAFRKTIVSALNVRK